jgi:hypothetical protein
MAATKATYQSKMRHSALSVVVIVAKLIVEASFNEDLEYFLSKKNLFFYLALTSHRNSS